MTEAELFMEELLAEAELKEEKQSIAYYDLLVMEIQKMEAVIAHNFEQAEAECKIINDWALQKNSKLNDKIEFLKKKLEAYIREEGQKTIDLPHGILKIRKLPDKVEIEDLDSFLANANQELITLIPEQIKPNLNKIKAWIKSKPLPKGIKLIDGKEEFTLKLKEVSNDTAS